MGVFTRRSTSLPAHAPAVRPLTGGAGARTPLPYRTVRTLTASARVLNLKSREELEKISRGRAGNEWQAEAWEYFDAVGEVKYALTMVSNIVSRLRLYAGQVGEASQAPTPADPDDPGGAAAIAALARLDSAFGGQPGLLRDASLNLAVSGECYLVQRRANPAINQPESWDIRSTDELTVNTAGKVTLQTQRMGSGPGFRKELPDSTYMARIWRPHPRWSDDPESSMRGVLELCQELLLLSRTFRATARSRLNAGMLYLPDGLSVAAAPDTEQTGDDEEGMVVPLMPPAADEQDTDEFEDQLLDAMTTPISDEESAAAVVPLLVRGPAELGEKIKLIKFERSFDAALVARADRVLDRILQALDVPKDVVTGLANVKYSNAVAIDESLFKANVEPLALVLCDALTQVFLHPTMKAAGISEDDLKKYVIWYDPSEVTTRPNRGDDADSGYEKHSISASSWRRAHGFSDGDAPDPTEVALRMLVEKGTMTPELSEALLAVIAPDVMENVRQASQANSPAPLPDDVAQALGVGGQPPATDGQAPPPAEPASPPPNPPAGTPPPSDGLPDVIPEGRLL